MEKKKIFKYEKEGLKTQDGLNDCVVMKNDNERGEQMIGRED